MTAMAGFRITFQVMKRGYTLVEMVTVVTMLGLLLAVGTPRLRSTMDRWAVERSVRAVESAFYRARFAAVMARRRVRLDFSSDSLVGSFVGKPDSMFFIVTGPTVRGVSLVASRRTVQFSPTGLGYGAANTRLVFRRGTATDTIAISRLGRWRRMR